MSDSEHVKKLSRRNKIAQWSHISYAERLNPEHPDAKATEIAKRYIALFDKALRARGYVVASAVEIEADAFEDAHSKHVMDRTWKERNLFAYDKMVQRDRVVEGLRHIIAQEHERNPGASSEMEECVKETGMRDIEIKTVPATPLETATRVAEIKKHLYEGTREGFRQLTGNSYWQKADTEMLHPFSQKMLSDMALGRVRFYGLENGLLHGEHINLSVHRPPDAINAEISPAMMKVAGLTQDENFTRGFGRFLSYYGLNDWMMLRSGKASDLRMKTRYHTSDEELLENTVTRRPDIRYQIGSQYKHHSRYFRMRVPEENEKCRMEWRIPDAHCNPYLSMMHAMAHLYAYVEQFEKSPQHAGQGTMQLPVSPCRPSTFFRQMDMDAYEQRFKSNSIVLTMMEEVGRELHLPAETTRLDSDSFRQAVVQRAHTLDRSTVRGAARWLI